MDTEEERRPGPDVDGRRWREHHSGRGAGREEGLYLHGGVFPDNSNISPSLQATPNVLNKAATVGKAPAGGATAAAAAGVTDADMKKFTVSNLSLLSPVLLPPTFPLKDKPLLMVFLHDRMMRLMKVYW